FSARRHGEGADLREHRRERHRPAPRAGARRSHLVAHRRQRGTRPIVVTTARQWLSSRGSAARAPRRGAGIPPPPPASLVTSTPRKENRMYTSKLATMVAILATTAGFAALAGTAAAQIPGETGGDVVTKHPVPAFDDPFFFPTNGIVPVQWGHI